MLFRSTNIDYNYVVTPFNNDNVAGKYYFSPFVFTLPTLINFQYKDISNNYVSFTIDGCYNSVRIARYDINSNSVTFKTNGFTYYDYLVTPNTEYSYITTAINGDDLDGNSIELPFICSLPEITNLYFSDISFSKITINIQGYYKFILIQKIGFPDINPGYVTKYTDVDLYPNTPYKYYITAFNMYDQGGYAYISDDIYTSAVIYDVSFISITDSSFTLQIYGIYNHYRIVRNDNIKCVSIIKVNCFSIRYKLIKRKNRRVHFIGNF